MNRIMKYLPEYYERIQDFVELAETESIELDNMQGAIDRLFDDQFVLTSDEQAIRRRERMLGIQADPTRETLDFRKQRILNRYRTRPPFTIRYLQQQLDFLVGPGRALAEVDVQNFILTITTAIDEAVLFEELEHTVNTIKPANIIYQQNTALEDVIELDEHIAAKTVTWNYVLGSWSLGEKPFTTLGQEVIIK